MTPRAGWDARVRKERNYVRARNRTRGYYSLCCLIPSDSLALKWSKCVNSSCLGQSAFWRTNRP